VQQARVGVVGLGLIGGSLLAALQSAAGPADPGPLGWDSDARVRAAAAEAGLELAGGADELASACSVVVVAVPPHAAVATVLAALRASPSAVVTDVTSVKRTVLDGVSAAAAPAEQARFVGGHPLCGDDRGGISSAREDLFAGATWALCPGWAALESVCAVSALVELVGARALIAEAAEHDRAVAWSSHLPHLLAGMLAAPGSGTHGDRELVAALSGGSLRDGTRVAGADPSLWLDILHANADSLRAALELAAGCLNELAAALERGEWGVLEGALRDGMEGRQRIARVRWSAARWEPAEVPLELWRETLLGLGHSGRAVRGLAIEDGRLRYQRAAADAT